MNRTLHQSDTSELSGMTLGPSRTIRQRATSEPSGKTLGPSHILCRSTADEPSGSTPGPSRIEHSAEVIHEQAVWQYAGPVSNRTICRSDMRKLSGSRLVCAEQPPMICRASRRRRTTDEPLCKPPCSRRASAVHRVIRCRGATEIEPNPLDYSL